MQTVVEWLEKKLIESGVNLLSEEVEFIEQANKMFEKQMIDFHIEVMKKGLINEGERKWDDGFLPKIKETAEQSYNETFKK